MIIKAFYQKNFHWIRQPFNSKKHDGGKTSCPSLTRAPEFVQVSSPDFWVRDPSGALLLRAREGETVEVGGPGRLRETTEGRAALPDGLVTTAVDAPPGQNLDHFAHQPHQRLWGKGRFADGQIGWCPSWGHWWRGFEGQERECQDWRRHKACRPANCWAPATGWGRCRPWGFSTLYLLKWTALSGPS